MRISLLLAAAIATTLASSFPAAAQPASKPTTVRQAVRYGMALAPGDPVPTFAGPDLRGNPLDVTYVGSRATVIGFWSSACVPCRVQSVALQQLFAQRGETGVQVVGVATDTGSPQAVPAAALKYLDELGGTYPVVRSTTEIETAWRGITILPTTFLVAKDGKLLRRYVGADDAIMTGLFADIAAHLAGRPLADQAFPEAAPKAGAGDGTTGGAPSR